MFVLVRSAVVTQNRALSAGSLERIDSMRVAALAALVFLALAAGTLARAASKPANRPAMERAAKKACITGDVRKGIDLLGELYVDTNDATYIYNQARCFEQNHRWQDAVDRFKESLRKMPDLSAKDKTDVERHIADCEAQQGKVPAPSAVALPTPAPAQPAPIVTLPQAPSSGTAQPAAASTSAAANPPSTSRLRTAGIVAAAGGAAVLVGGLVFNLQANSLTKELNGPIFDRDKASRRDTYKTLAWVGYGVGAAALVTGTVLFVLGGRSGTASETPATVALIPVLLPGLATLSLQGSY
jgi:hypothetical protein